MSADAFGDDNDNKYRMDRRERGKFIIISNKTFQPQTHMAERGGTDKDAESLMDDFGKLGFDVQTKKDQTREQMKKLMIDGKCHC